MSEEQILNEIEQNKEDYIKFLQKMIQAESYNPPGNEKNVAIVIEEFLKDSGLKIEIYSFGDNRANLIAYLNDNFNGRNLLYNGHMDVVPPGNEEDWKFPPLSGIIKGGKKNKKIFGRGAVDMKSGLSAMVISLKILKKLGLKLSGNLILNAVADEETGGKLGAKWSLENLLKSIKCDFTVVGEMTGMQPIGKGISVGEKGHLHLKVITNGIMGHSMMPSMAKNSINMMSEIILNLDKMEKYMPKIEPPISYERYKEIFSNLFPSKEQFERIFNEQEVLQFIFDSMTQFSKSFTLINGGFKENVIPDRCEAIIDFRLLPGQEVDMILDSLKKVITKDLGYEVKNEPRGNPREIFVYIEKYRYSEPSYLENWENSQYLKDFEEIFVGIFGGKPAYILGIGTADSRYFRNSNYCPQTIIFGPGEAFSAHAIDESIKIQDFIDVIKVYTLFAYNFLK